MVVFSSKRLNATSTIILMMTFCLLLYNKERMNIGYPRTPLQYLSQCECYRDYSQHTLGHTTNISLENTTCSEAAYYRGPHQKVISFTYFDPPENELVPKNKTAREYFRGIEENLNLVKKFYPGYNMRLYYQVSSDTTLTQLCHIACGEPLLDLCPAMSLPKFGNATKLYPLIWRFLPAIDPQVDLFFSRDLDSRISLREVEAVTEFLNSDVQVHVMRDHPAHTASMMGGMWGAKVEAVRTDLRQSFAAMFKNGVSYVDRNLGGWDQIALQRFVWPWAKKVSVSHDSYTCKKFSHTRPFPTRRETGPANYVGSVVSLNGSLTTPCPEKCRPSDHRDWEHC